MDIRKHVAVAWPTGWEVSELARPEVASRYRFSYLPLAGMGRAHPDLATEIRGQFAMLRVEAFLAGAAERLRRDPPAGVIGTEDHLGAIVAAELAHRLGLPGPSPQALLTCQHKHRSRIAQAASVPEATPRFAVVDPEDLHAFPDSIVFPCFAKPVRGSFSVFARRVEDLDDLRRLARIGWRDRWLWDLRQRPFEALLRRRMGGAEGSRSFLVEELLGGRHLSVEGFRHRGETRVLGVLEASMYEGTESFRRFVLPAEGVPARVADVAARVMREVGFDEGLFEIEMYWDAERDLRRIIEINPRMCPQFADLVEKVNDANSYDLLLSLATGEEPRWTPSAGRFGCAASFVFRIFEGERVVRVPSEGDVARARERFPDLRVHLFAGAGTSASARVRPLHDTSSVRVATVHLGGADRADLMCRFREAFSMLPFEVSPPRDYARELTRD